LDEVGVVAGAGALGVGGVGGFVSVAGAEGTAWAPEAFPAGLALGAGFSAGTACTVSSCRTWDGTAGAGTADTDGAAALTCGDTLTALKAAGKADTSWLMLGDVVAVVAGLGCITYRPTKIPTSSVAMARAAAPIFRSRRFSGCVGGAWSSFGARATVSASRDARRAAAAGFAAGGLGLSAFTITFGEPSAGFLASSSARSRRDLYGTADLPPRTPSAISFASASRASFDMRALDGPSFSGAEGIAALGVLTSGVMGGYVSRARCLDVGRIVARGR
jgi:hypothetical protein